MRLPPDFEKTLATKSNEELLDMLVHGADYLPEAVTAAADELSARKVPAAELEHVQRRIIARDYQAAEEEAKPEKFSMAMTKVIFHFGFWSILAGAAALIHWLLNW